MCHVLHGVCCRCYPEVSHCCTAVRACLAQVAEQTPLTAARYGELALEAGIPPGVLNVIQGGAPRCLCRCLCPDNASEAFPLSTLVLGQAAPVHSTQQRGLPAVCCA